MATGLMLPNVCIMDRQHGAVQLELIDQDLSESIQQLRGVSPTSNINTNQPNTISWHMSGWVEPTGLKAAGSCSPAANKVARAGRFGEGTHGSSTEGGTEQDVKSELGQRKRSLEQDSSEEQA